MTPLKPIFILAIVATLFVVPEIAFSQTVPEILITTDKLEYYPGDILVVHGLVEEKKMPIVAMKIYDPLGVLLSANNVNLEADNSFTKILTLDSPFYDLPGTYSIQVEYGKLKSQTTFDVVGEKEPFEIIDDFLDPAVLVMVTDKDVYYDNEYVVIAGIVTAIDEPSVLIGIYDSLGNPTGFYFADIDENYEFSISFLAKAGINFKTDGVYSAKAHYGDSENIINFEFLKQNPLSKYEQITKPVTPPTPSPKTTPSKEITKPVAPSPIVSLPKNDVAKQTNNQPEEENDNLTVEDIELGKLLNEIQLNCDNSEFVDSIIYYDGLGPALLRLCKYSEAILFIDKSLQKDPNNIEILTNKGIALNKLGYYNEALRYYDRVLSIDSKFVPAINNKANILAKMGNFDTAQSLYFSALEIEPGHYTSKINLSKIQQKIEPQKPQSEVVYVAQSTEEHISPPVLKEETIVVNNNEKQKLIVSQEDTSTIIKQIELTLLNLKNTLFSFLS